MNPNLDKLHPYPFEKLTALKADITPPAALSHIALSIGEPKHAPPAFVQNVVAENLDKLGKYPATKAMPELRQAVADWAGRRFHCALDAESQVLPVNGTREALFAFAQAMIDSRATNPLVVSPNPFYQVYEGAALLAGAQAHYLPCRADNGFVPDFSAVSADIWQQCQLLYLCSPGNPTGTVIGRDTLKQLIELADAHDFIIASDECYSEIYFDEARPPVGLLQVCSEIGRDDYRRCVVFHSLSKRSNLPGLRSGFVAGDAALLAGFLRYRTYHGSAMAPHHQLASIAAWSDEAHVVSNRDAYREKFQAVLSELDGVWRIDKPAAGFYLWAQTPLSDTEFARRLFAEQHVSVLPGSFLSRTIDNENPGRNRVRMALVATVEECVDAAQRLRQFVQSL